MTTERQPENLNTTTFENSADGQEVELEIVSWNAKLHMKGGAHDVPPTCMITMRSTLAQPFSIWLAPESPSQFAREKALMYWNWFRMGNGQPATSIDKLPTAATMIALMRNMRFPNKVVIRQTDGSFPELLSAEWTEKTVRQVADDQTELHF
jgi:hypothetical protein